jgi:predicted dehydrogenase
VPTASRSVRAAVVGAGLMGRWHADAIQRAGGRVIAIVDADATRARQLASRLRERSAIATDVGEALTQHAIDVVHVCTPVESHESVAGLAIEAGAHVLVEKPLASDAATVARLHAMAAEQGLLLCPVHQFLFQPGILLAERWLPTLGAVRHFEVVACSAGADGASDAQREVVARDILPHGLALARRLLGAASLTSEWSHAAGSPGELRATTSRGATSLSLVVSMHARPTENSLTLRCDGGTIRANLYHGFATLERGVPSRFEKLARPFTGASLVLAAAAANLARRTARGEPAYPGLRELVARFHLATTGASQPPVSASESIDVARARDSLLEMRVGESDRA